MTAFVQIIEYRTSKPDEIMALGEEFRTTRETTEGPSPTRLLACADRDDPSRYLTIVEFASYEDAMANSERPDTSEFAARMTELCDGPVIFHNLDLIQTMEYTS